MAAALVPIYPFAATRAAIGSAFPKLPPHRALAVAPSPEVGSSWRTGAHPSPEVAANYTLEACQVRFGEPCALLAVDDAVQLPPSGRPLPTRDMPRVRYAGRFDPAQIPTLPPEAVAQRTDLTGYAAALGPKAIALHPSRDSLQRAFAVTGARTQREAEERALRACNEDPPRAGRDGPCFLYAVGAQVVLPQHRTSADPPLTSRKLAAALDFLPEERRMPVATSYLRHPPYKILAAASERRGVWFSSGYGSSVEAEELTLERCQMRYGVPCAILAANEVLQVQPGRRPQSRDMPRLRYAGRFDPGQVPGISASQRAWPEVSGYASAPEPKAIAIHPWGRVFAAVGADSQQAAQEAALRACNDDPNRHAQDGSCFLYAVGMQVALPQRRTGPITPPSAPSAPAERPASSGGR